MLDRSPREFRFLLLAIAISMTLPSLASAYDVEADSSSNSVFVLLRNLDPSADFLSISVGDDLPSFVTSASAVIVPASVAAGESDLAAVEFDVSAGAPLGQTGDLEVTISGVADGRSTDIILTVPLKVVATAAEAQGEVGVGVPAPDPGGTDTDGDGVTDALEIAFGSDPLNSASVPGKPWFADVPGLGWYAMLAVLSLFLLSGAWLARSNSRTAAGWR